MQFRAQRCPQRLEPRAVAGRSTAVLCLTDRSRRPSRQANRLPVQIEALLVQLKHEHPSWGAPKIREKLRRRLNDLPVGDRAMLERV